MENFPPIEEEEKHLTFSENIINDLKLSSRWGSFISLFSVFLSVFSLVFYIYFFVQIVKKQGGTFERLFDSFPFKAYVVIFILLGFLALYFLSCWALWQFSTQMNKSIELKSSTVTLLRCIISR